MPRIMCGISPRSRSGTSWHGPWPHTARKRDRAQPRSCRTWPLPAPAMRLALGVGPSGTWAVLILLRHSPFACKEEIYRPTSVWSWSGLSDACPGAARRRAHPCRCGTGCQPTDACTCQYCRRPLPGIWRWRKTCTQPRPGYCALPIYCRHSPLAGCAITGSGK